METPHVHGGMPLVGIAMASIGIGGWLYNGAVAMAAHGLVLAQAPAVHEAASQWTSMGQTISGILTVVGAIITWLSLQRQNVNDARRREMEKDEEARRESRRLDADTETAVALKRLEVKMAELHLEQQRARLHMEGVSGLMATTSPAPEPEKAP